MGRRRLEVEAKGFGGPRRPRGRNPSAQGRPVDVKGVEVAVNRFVASVLGGQVDGPDTADLERKIKEVDAAVKAITASIDLANPPLLNERLTQQRQRKEQLEREIAAAQASGSRPNEAALRQWAHQRITGLADAMNGRRDQEVRNVLASCVERIVVTPSTKSGIVAINPRAYDTCGYKENDRPEGRSYVDMVAGAGFEPATFGL